MLEAIQNMTCVNSLQSDILVVNYGNLNRMQLEWGHHVSIFDNLALPIQNLNSVGSFF